MKVLAAFACVALLFCAPTVASADDFDIPDDVQAIIDEAGLPTTIEEALDLAALIAGELGYDASLLPSVAEVEAALAAHNLTP